MSRATGRGKKASGNPLLEKSGRQVSVRDNDSSSIAATRRQTLFGWAVSLGLILSILAVYAQVRGFDFVNYDDDLYVYGNAHVRAGLTFDSIRWAFTAVVASNWMPVTLLSHMLDAQLFGIASGMHHMVNVLFHALSSILLFICLRRATGADGPSAFVAFVFALHPLHVGSVAWVSERKDVLSAFFWFLALYGYLRYAERPGVGRYLAMAAAFSVGLMAKPMLVTFPFTVWLFDLWPLRRFEWPRTTLEKLPLFALSAAAATVTYLVQGSSGAMSPVPAAMRIENAFITYLTYIRQTLWPVRLTVMYPYPPSIPWWQAAAALAVILAISVFAIRTWRTRPYVAVGWFWYLGTLVPVIGFVQVGVQSHADRYMYIPMVGLSLIVAWGAQDVIAKWPRTRGAVTAAGTALCAACMVLAWQEVRYWENSETLFGRAIEVTEDNAIADLHLGMYETSTGRFAEAIPTLEAALRVRPDFAEAHNNLGVAMARNGDYASAVPHFEAAIRAKPDDAEAHYNLGSAMIHLGDYAAAISQFEAAIRAKQDFAEPHARLGLLLADLGRTQEAIGQLEAAQSIQPDPAITDALIRLRAAQK